MKQSIFGWFGCYSHYFSFVTFLNTIVTVICVSSNRVGIYYNFNVHVSCAASEFREQRDWITYALRFLLPRRSFFKWGVSTIRERTYCFRFPYTVGVLDDGQETVHYGTTIWQQWRNIKYTTGRLYLSFYYYYCYYYTPSMVQGTRLVKERRRVAGILLLLALVFFTCWLPYNIIILLLDTQITRNIDMLPYMLLLGHFNSALNPIIYCAMSKNFRISVKHLMMVDILRSFRFRYNREPRDLQVSNNLFKFTFILKLKIHCTRA